MQFMTSSAEQKIDPFIFEKGAAPTVDRLRELGRDIANGAALRGALHEYLSAYVAVSTPDLERLFFAGERCRVAELENVEAWCVDWLKRLDAALHIRGGTMLVAFLSGFYGEKAERRLASIRRDLDKLTQTQAEYAEILDADFTALQQQTISS